jgi:hypothetical protein
MNDSKINGRRFWEIWKKSGAVSGLIATKKVYKVDNNVAEAKMWLGFARNRNDDNESNVGYCRECLVKAGKELSDIGTSVEELAQLLIDGYVAEAKMWLGFARNRFDDNESNIDYCREYLAKAGKTLSDIGTSEEELSQLLVDGYAAEAKKWLGFARNRNDENESSVGYCREYLVKAGKTLSDIGTSEEELAQLLIDGYVAEAKMWLGFARNRNDESESSVSYCREYVAKAGKTLSDIGTSEEEISALLKSVAA